MVSVMSLKRVLAPQSLVVQVDHVGITPVEAGRDEAPRIVRAATSSPASCMRTKVS